jgi:MOSC domain-containing protein YiiM
MAGAEEEPDSSRDIQAHHLALTDEPGACSRDPTCEDRPMIEVELPASAEAPELVRSFGACLASVTEAGPHEVPLPVASFRGAVAHWRSWLAGRGCGLVPIAQARKFNWPGYWLAVLGDDKAVLMFGTPSGVVLSPQDAGLLGRPATDLPILEGFVVSSLDPSSPGMVPALPTGRGTTVAIAIAEEATGPMHSVDRASALAGRGLDGDRYAAKAGTFTPASDTARGYDLTLIESEVLDQLSLPGGATLDYLDARRNIVTRGVDLNALVGRRFRIGDVECLGRRLCEPCSHLERLTGQGVLRALIHRGGLRADILSDGQIEVGSAIEPVV